MLARTSNSQRPQRYALCIFTQVMRRKELEAKKRALCKGACPSRFPWRTSPRKRHPPTLRTTEAPRCKKRLDESLSQDSEEERDLSVSFSESTPESSSASPIEMIEEIQKSLDPSELLKH